MQLLIFPPQYNSMGLWTTETLKASVDFLARLGYVCYFDAPQGLTRLSGCWAPAYEFKGWSNVICAVHGHALQHRFHERSFVKELGAPGPGRSGTDHRAMHARGVRRML